MIKISKLGEFTIVFAVLYIYMTVYYTEVHEFSHEQIFSFYGLESETKYVMFGLLGAYTKPVIPEGSNFSLSVTERENMRVLTANAEIIGYNAFAILNGILIGCFLIGYALLLRKK